MNLNNLTPAHQQVYDELRHKQEEAIEPIFNALKNDENPSKLLTLYAAAIASSVVATVLTFSAEGKEQELAHWISHIIDELVSNALANEL